MVLAQRPRVSRRANAYSRSVTAALPNLEIWHVNCLRDDVSDHRGRWSCTRDVATASIRSTCTAVWLQALRPRPWLCPHGRHDAVRSSVLELWPPLRGATPAKRGTPLNSWDGPPARARWNEDGPMQAARASIKSLRLWLQARAVSFSCGHRSRAATWLIDVATRPSISVSRTNEWGSALASRDLLSSQIMVYSQPL
jgi:hypothetical protein